MALGCLCALCRTVRVSGLIDTRRRLLSKAFKRTAGFSRAYELKRAAWMETMV